MIPAPVKYDDAAWKDYLQTARAIGIREDVEMRKERDGYYIVDGRHRSLACKELGWLIPAKIVTDLNAQTAGIVAFVKNAHRRNDPPWSQAQFFEQALSGGKVSQEDVARASGVSQATVSRRMRLLKLGPAIGLRVGKDIDENALEPLYALLAHGVLFEAASKAVQARKEPIGRAWDTLNVVTAALTGGAKPLAVNIEAVDHNIRWDAAFKAGLAKIHTIALKADNDHERVFALDVERVRVLADGVKATREAEAKAARKSGKGKSAKSPQQLLEAETRRVQLDLLVRHVGSRTSWPDDFLREALANMVRGARNCALRKADRAALSAILGSEAEPHGDEELFRKLWAKDRAEAMQYAAGVLFLNRYEWEDAGAKLLTGKTNEQARDQAKLNLRSKGTAPAKADVKAAKGKGAKAA